MRSAVDEERCQAVPECRVRIIDCELCKGQLAGLIPLGVSLVSIEAHLGIDLYGGIVTALSLLSALAEVTMYSCLCVD